MVIDSEYSITPLVLAVIGHSIEQARKGNDEARAWLYCDGALWLDVIRGWHPDYTRRWLDHELAKRTRKSQTQAGGYSAAGTRHEAGT